MPALELMYWNSAQKRWFKKYRGKMYAVSPRRLGCEPTKEVSRQAANEWWQRKQAEIDEALGVAKRHPANLVQHYQGAIENHRLFAKWHRKYGNPKVAERSEEMMEWLKEALASDNPPFPLTTNQEDPRYGGGAEDDELEDDDFVNLADDDTYELVWSDRFEKIRQDERNEKAVPKENTIRSHIDDYLLLKKAQCQAKGKIATYSSAKQWLEVFKNWVDPFAPVTSIDERLWKEYFIYLSNRLAQKEISPATAKDYIGAARSFIRNRWEEKYIELPRNLTSKQLAISVPIKAAIVFTVEEVQAYLQAAKRKTRLYVLLMLNCGMYPQDITFLQHEEVNWEQGRINRKRTKTRDRSKNVPKVDYPLWRETFALLTKYRSNHPELVLLNENGKPLLTEKESKNGKMSCNQNIQFAYRRLQEKMKVEGKAKKGLKAFRKTGSTLMEQSQYGRFAEHYLGEAPHTTASKHYIHKNGAEFDEAIWWLGEQFGIK
jgi:integrase